MALQQTDWYFDYLKDPDLTRRLARNQLERIGSGSGDATAWNQGYARLWEDNPPNPYKYGRKVAGTPSLNETEQRVDQINSWQDLTPNEKRAEIRARIDAQVFQAGGTQLVEDPTAQRSIETTSGGASNRRAELQETPDQNLDAFDPTITPTPVDGAGFIEAKYMARVEELEPWPGAMDNIYGIAVYLDVLTATGDEGQDARAHLLGSDEVVDNSVLPLTRIAGTNQYRIESQDGRKWSDPASPARVRLYWANGSIPVDDTRELNGLGDQQYAVVRYGGS